MAAPTVVLLPLWVGTHFTSMIDASKRLLTGGGGRVASLTVLIMPPPTEPLAAEVDGYIRSEEASGSGLDVRFVRLPAVEPPAESRDDISKSISRLVLLHGAHVRSAISSLASPVAALVSGGFFTAPQAHQIAHVLCFGSGGFFTAPQAHQIAHGLERSGRRFLWVLRGPWVPDKMSVSDANLAELLPEGFLERTRDRGLVWPTEAPQTEILAHAAVGGFVTHAGWNLVLESLWFSVPMAPWPLYSEHHLNALTLVASCCMGVAVAMKVDRERNNFVEAAELERAVKELMGGGEEGRKAREKAAEMRAACRDAVDEGGSSYAALRRLAEEMCKGHTNNNH